METCKSGSEGGCRKPVVFFLQQGAFALPNEKHRGIMEYYN